MWAEVIFQEEAKRAAITHDKEELKEEREKDGERRERGGARDGTDEQDGGIINLGNTFFKQEKKGESWKIMWRQGGGEENGLKKEDACMGK